MNDAFMQIGRSLQSHQLTHEVMSVSLGVSGTILLLLAWYLARSERASGTRLSLLRPSIGWALSALFFWLSTLLGALSLLVLFSKGPLPTWGIVIIAGIVVSALALIWSYGQEDQS